MTTSPNKGYTQPAYNTLVGTWGTELNNNLTGIVDSNLGGSSSISLSSTTPVTLSTTQAQSLTVFLTGALLSNITIYSPNIGFYFVVNNTSGNYAVTWQANFGSGGVGSGLVVPQGQRVFLVSDTTNGVGYAAAPATGVLPGELKAYAGSSAPTGWLLCYGQAISRSVYAALYNAIGTTYGVGDGSTTFNIPDLRGRTLFGLDNMGGTPAGRLTGSSTGNIASPTTLGSAGGEENHASTVAETASHTHTASVTDPGHTHNIEGYINQGGVTRQVWTTQLYSDAGPFPTSSATTGITVTNANQGGGAAHNTTPPGVVINWLIKT